MTRYSVTHENVPQAHDLTADEAWTYVLRHGNTSVNYALEHNGWSVNSESLSYVGRTGEGERVWVTIRTETLWAGPAREGENGATIIPTFETTEHGRVTRVTRVSISGMGVWKGGRSVSHAGQMVEAVDAVRDFRDSSWTRTDVRSLLKIWDRWHLNDMRAACSHMTLPEDTSYDARRGIACPVTGYLYGSAWLVEEPPADVLTELERLSELPEGKIPDYVR